ncbi:MAG: L,D-transpeptidase family protein, partial [Verrucomicrobiales bacterium]
MNRLFVPKILLPFLALMTAHCAPPTSARAKEVARRVTPTLTKALAAKDLKFGAPVYMRIFKETKELELWVQHASGPYRLFKTYAPEGFYFVPPKMMNPNSSYHLSFNLGYPNTYDRAHDRTGSFLMVHGSFVSIGCFAVTDPRIEEIYTLADAALRNGQPLFRVHCFPF